MNITFKNYWGTRIFLLISIQSMNIWMRDRQRRMTYIGLLNFGITIAGKPKPISNECL